MDAYANVVRGSKLKLKKGKKKKEVVELAAKPAGDNLTDAERRHKRRRVEKDREEIKQAVKKSHRQKVEELNERLGSLTEHNDIPRVSAAGNG